MTSLAAIVDSLVADEGGYRVDAPADWAQGRTLFGGMMAALSHAAALRAHPDPGPLRSAQFAFVGPSAGRLRLRPALLRRGRSAAIVGVDCAAEDGEGDAVLAARATFVFGGARPSVVTHDRIVAPIVPPPEACAPMHRTTKPLPGHLGQFDFRLAGGSRLFEPAAAPEFTVWTRLREGGGVDPVTALLAIADSLPGAAMVAFPKPAAISTMTWTIDLHGPAPGAEQWHLLSSSSESAADGYSRQEMRVYDRGGSAVASGRQVVALFV